MDVMKKGRRGLLQPAGRRRQQSEIPDQPTDRVVAVIAPAQRAEGRELPTSLCTVVKGRSARRAISDKLSADAGDRSSVSTATPGRSTLAPGRERLPDTVVPFR